MDELPLDEGRDWGKIANEILMMLVWILGVIELAKLTATALTYPLTHIWPDFPALAVLVIQIGFAFLAGTWAALNDVPWRKRSNVAQ